MKTKLTLYTYCFCCSWCLPLVTFKRRSPAKGARSHLSSPPQDVRQLLAPVPTQPTWAPAPPWQVAREGAGVDGQRLTEHHGASGLSFLGLSPCYSIMARPYYPAGSPGMWLLLLPSEWPSFWQSHCVSPGSPHARHGDQSCFVSLKLHHTHYLWILPCFLWFNMPNMWITFVTNICDFFSYATEETAGRAETLKPEKMLRGTCGQLNMLSRAFWHTLLIKYCNKKYIARVLYFHRQK